MASFKDVNHKYSFEIVNKNRNYSIYVEEGIGLTPIMARFRVEQKFPDVLKIRRYMGDRTKRN